MNELPQNRHLNIVPDTEHFATSHDIDVPPNDILEHILPFLPDDFNGKYKVIKHGIVGDELNDNIQRVNVSAYNPDEQFGPVLKLASIASIRPGQSMVVYYVRRSLEGGYKLQKPNPSKSAANYKKYVDCGPEEIEVVSGWLRSFQPIEDINSN